MQSRSKQPQLPRVLLVLVALLGFSVRARGESAEEKALWSLWNRHQAETNGHPAFIDAGVQFEKTYPNSPLVGMVRGLVAWHCLKADQLDRATAMFQSLETAGTEPVAVAAAEMARHWLTRLDREKVRAALKVVYNQRIEYPESIDAVGKLPEAQRPPLTDRWGKPWEYRLANFKHITGLKAQRYVLDSATLKGDSDLVKALQRPYASTIQLKPARLLSATSTGPSVVEFAAGGAKPKLVVLSAGTSDGAVMFVRMGETYLLLADGDYWLLLAPPK